MNSKSDRDQQNAQRLSASARSGAGDGIEVSLLTGGSDRPYVYGLTDALLSKNATLDIIGSDELNDPEICNKPGVNFLNLRGDQRPGANFRTKISRIASYNSKWIGYRGPPKPQIFHTL